MIKPAYPLRFISTTQYSDWQWITVPQILSCGFLSIADPLNMQLPQEFGGPVRGTQPENPSGLGSESSPYTPEDLFGMALGNCFAATFKVFAQNSKLGYGDLLVRVVYVIDLDERGLPHITEAAFDIHLRGVSDKVRAERLLQKVSKSCLIINAVQAEKGFTFTVEEKPTHQAHQSS